MLGINFTLLNYVSVELSAASTRASYDVELSKNKLILDGNWSVLSVENRSCEVRWNASYIIT